MHSAVVYVFFEATRVSLIGNDPRFLLLRAGVGVVSMTSFFTTLQRIPMGASVSLKYLSPIFAAVFAVLFLRERVPRYKWFFFGLALIGVMLLKGFDTRIDTISLILGLTGAVTAGLVYVIIRKIGQTEHPLVIINYFMLLAMCVSGIGMIPFLADARAKSMDSAPCNGHNRLYGPGIHDEVLANRKSEQSWRLSNTCNSSSR